MNKILVVDDCSSTRACVKAYSKKWGYEVIPAANAEEALAELEKPNSPQILLVDWVMPGMDGDELINHIRNQCPDRMRYIIMMSAKKTTKDIEDAFAAGADDYMAKPLVGEEIQARLGEAERVLSRDSSIHEALAKIGS